MIVRIVMIEQLCLQGCTVVAYIDDCQNSYDRTVMSTGTYSSSIYR